MNLRRSPGERLVVTMAALTTHSNTIVYLATRNLVTTMIVAQAHLEAVGQFRAWDMQP